ncbi:MAG: hypothetical protein N2Z62_11075 [Rhodobacteraceae bacterium]|nr:hypothetical protein [Paracoccaceae bacterium]
MAHIEAFHSSRGGGDFLGLRHGRSGGVEIVYDDGVTRRMVWRVKTPGVCVERVGEALGAAVDSLRVVPALMAELRKRSIAIEALPR